MKFTVLGADQETGEDIEMTVEAATREDASAKANRRGILVSSCNPELSGKNFVAQTSPPAASRPRTVFRTLRTLVVAIGLLMATCIGIYYLHLKPQNDQIQQTLADAAKQSEQSAAMSRKNTEHELQALRERAAKHGVSLDASPKPVTSEPDAAERAVKQVAVERYVALAEPFVREIKSLRSRVASGANYTEFNEKLLAMADAFAQLGVPPPEAVPFVESANEAVDLYQRAGRQWMLAIRNNLFVAEKQRIREMLEQADGHVQALDGKFNTLKELTR